MIVKRSSIPELNVLLQALTQAAVAGKVTVPRQTIADGLGWNNMKIYRSLIRLQKLKRIKLGKGINRFKPTEIFILDSNEITSQQVEEMSRMVERLPSGLSPKKIEALLDLVEQQQAEIERLKAEKEKLEKLLAWSETDKEAVQAYGRQLNTRISKVLSGLAREE